LFGRFHLATSGAGHVFTPNPWKEFQHCCFAQQIQSFQPSCMIETVVMLAIGLSMAGVVLGVLTTDESV